MTKYVPYPFFHDDMPIDISFVFEDEKPAGGHGFLKTLGRDFVFEDGTKVKFWGTNFNGWGCFPEHDYAEKLAKRLSKTGLNLVRFHQLDSEWHTPNIFSFTKGKRMSDGKLDPESLDRLDYLIHCLKREGIYCYMDMFTYRKFRSDEGVPNAKSLRDAAKPLGYFDRRLIELQKELCRELWTHKNPYTGLRYCDDPVFVLAEIVNESDFFSLYWKVPFPEPYHTEFLNLFDKWLTDNNIAKKAGDFDLNDMEDETIISFKMHLQETHYADMIAYMRSIGVKIPITGTNHAICPANVKTQLTTDFTDVHPYFYDFDGSWSEFEKHFKNKSITHMCNSYLLDGVYASVEDKPTYISEWDAPWPNEYRADSVLYSAATGLLQGWSGYAIHTYSYSARLERMDILGREILSQQIGGTPYRQGIFTTWNDPAKYGLFYHAALMTRRGDVKASQNVTKISHISKAKWNEAEAMANIDKRLTVSDFDFSKKAQKADTVIPDEVLSDTKELFISRKKNYGYIDTPRTKCVYGFLGKNGTIELDGIKVTCETDFSVIAMSSLTDDSITSSDNILLTTVGRAQNTDAKFTGDMMTEYGKAPVLVEVIKADIEIETDIDSLAVWAISPEGFYIGKAPSKYENGKFSFSLGETSQSMYYLIVKE